MLKLTRVSPGTHGLHLHAQGLCEPPKFESAGPHYRPRQPALPPEDALPLIDARVTL